MEQRTSGKRPERFPGGVGRSCDEFLEQDNGIREPVRGGTQSEGAVFVLQRVEARRFEPDDRQAAIEGGRQRFDQPPRLRAGAFDVARREPRPAAAQRTSAAGR